jgi:WG containing repeat
MAYVWDGKQYGFINQRGEVVIPLFVDRAHEFCDGLAPVKLNGKWGYIDQSASFVIEPKFDAALPFSAGVGRASVRGQWGYIDQKGEFVIAHNSRWPASFVADLRVFACKRRDRVAS